MVLISVSTCLHVFVHVHAMMTLKELKFPDGQNKEQEQQLPCSLIKIFQRMQTCLNTTLTIMTTVVAEQDVKQIKGLDQFLRIQSLFLFLNGISNASIFSDD